MKKQVRIIGTLLLIFFGGQLFFSFTHQSTEPRPAVKFPYKKAGLTERQAAAHLLSRFTYGAQPGEVDEVVALGLEQWFIQQLKADLPNHTLKKRLQQFDALKMDNAEINKTFPRRGQLVRMAIRDNAIERKAVRADNKKVYRDQMMAYMEENGYQIRGQLYRELINQKILRATYSENQLQEMLTSFWFNHFNVSITNNRCAGFILAYERDVIRPNALGDFETLLLATAHSPAMLTFLDNFKNSAEKKYLSPGADKQAMKRRKMLRRKQAIRQRKPKKALGVNENYAREIMELHTLGVDGGYTQKDVSEAARILTGWTVNPMTVNYKMRPNKRGMNADRLAERGFVLKGDFLFAANRHDMGAKVFLGEEFPANGGYEEGVRLIKMLAHHPSTAKFISTKLVIRFVSDNPPEDLIKKMAKTFMKTDGDIKQVLITMTTSRNFWENSRREKTKSPFELAISSVRSLNADIKAPYQLYRWITRMGEKMYYYQAPTGFPDNGQYWINTGSLLNRMNFGLAFASKLIPGIQFDIAALNQHREPESAKAALATYCQYLMPERELDETINRIAPALVEAEYHEKVNAAAGMATEKSRNKMERPGKRKYRKSKLSGKPKGDESMLARVVGIIIGSPEFQRR